VAAPTTSPPRIRASDRRSASSRTAGSGKPGRTRGALANPRTALTNRAALATAHAAHGPCRHSWETGPLLIHSGLATRRSTHVRSAGLDAPDGTVLIILGFLVVLGAITGGFWMHGGNPLVLLQLSEFVIIGGAALGTLLVTMNGAQARLLFVQIRGLIDGTGRYDRETYEETLLVLHQLFATGKADPRRIEADIERPRKSPVFKRYPRVMAHPEIIEVITDTYKVFLTGDVRDHHLAELLDHDLRRRRKDALAPAQRVETLSDALPGFGIVAAVLGVIVTMGHIGGAPEVIGHRIAGAMVGTFLGVLLAYGVTGPLAGALRSQVDARQSLFECIRNALLSHARGDVPSLSVEFGRRMIPEEMRPDFNDAEAMVRAHQRRAMSSSASKASTAA